MRIIKAGATSQSIYVCILDSASTTGGRKTGIVYNSAGLTAYYTLNGGSATAITLATLAAANSAYSSGGFKEVDATNQPGIYRLDLPNAAIASGPSVVVSIKGASGMVQVDLDIQLVAVDLQDATSFGLSRLDAAITSRMATYTQPTGFLAATFPGTVASTTNITAGTITTTTNLTNLPSIPANWITAAGITAAALNGKGDWNVGKTGYSLTATTGLGNQTADITGNLSGSVGSVTGAVGSVTGLTASDVAAIKAKTDNLPAAPAATSDIPSAASIASATMTTALAESYRADGATGTPAQLLYEVVAHLGESAIAGTTKTIKKVDGITAAATFTLDDAVTPTSITRAT